MVEAKIDQGILDVVTCEIEIECLPTNILEHPAVDVTEPDHAD